MDRCKGLCLKSLYHTERAAAQRQKNRITRLWIPSEETWIPCQCHKALGFPHYLQVRILVGMTLRVQLGSFSLHSKVKHLYLFADWRLRSALSLPAIHTSTTTLLQDIVHRRPLVRRRQTARMWKNKRVPTTTACIHPHKLRRRCPDHVEVKALINMSEATPLKMKKISLLTESSSWLP